MPSSHKFRKTTSGTRPVATYATAAHSIGGTSITINAATGWPTDTDIDFQVYRKDANGALIAGTVTTWTGSLSGTTISSMDLKAGTDQGYADGQQTVVVMAVTAAWSTALITGLLVEHTQAGLHTLGSSSTLTSTKVITGLNDTNGNELFKATATSSAVNEFTIANAATGAGPTLSATGGDTNIDINLTPKGSGVIKIAGNTVTPGAWQTWSPTFTNWNIGTGGSAGTVAYYAQVGKTVFYHIRSVLGTSGASVTGAITFTLPVNVNTTMNNGITEGYLIGQCKLLDASIAAYIGYIQTDTTSNTKATVMAQAANATYLFQATTGATVPFAWGAGDLFTAEGFYEAA